MFEACRNQKSCKFRHVTPQPVDEDKKQEIQILQQKIQKLEEDNKKITDHWKGRISILETEVKDLSKTVRDLTNNYNVQNDKTRLKSIERNSKNEHLSEEFYKMIDKFKNVMETLENTANNKFRKVAENLLKETYKIIINVQLKTSNNLYGMFDKTIDEENWIIERDKRSKFDKTCDKCEQILTKE